MPKWTAKQIAAITGGRLVGSESALVTSVCLDSRSVQRGSLFVPLKGRFFDGHQFINDAFQRGAAAVFSARSDVGPLNDQSAVIVVDSPLTALQQLASSWLRRVDPKVVAVTGSTGKTSTKEMIASVCSTTYHTFRSQGNLNSEQGLPLSLCHLEECHQVAVLEMAMRGSGQIKHLTDIAPPDVAVITNIGWSHIELLGSQENIARAKAEILEGLKPNGVAVLNGDDPWCRKIADYAPAERIFYGLDSSNDFYPQMLEVDASGCYSFRLSWQGEQVNVTLPLPGKHNVYNALAAAAVGVMLGIPLPSICKGIAAYQTIEKRQRIIVCKGFTVIDDTYNASPDSMRAGLEQLTFTHGVRKIAVLGDMLELGPVAIQLHREVGEVVAAHGIDYLICQGKLARHIGEAAHQAGMSKDRISCTGSNKESLKCLRDLAVPGCVVLVKGSRGMAMEEIVAGLCEE